MSALIASLQSETETKLYKQSYQQQTTDQSSRKWSQSIQKPIIGSPNSDNKYEFLPYVALVPLSTQSPKVTVNNKKLTMTKRIKPSVSMPSGFKKVPSHLEACNFLQHIKKFATSQRARNTHATSKSRHKFKQLCKNVNKWKTKPESHLKACAPLGMNGT